MKPGDHVVALYTCVDTFIIPGPNTESNGARIAQNAENANSASLAR